MCPSSAASARATAPTAALDPPTRHAQLVIGRGELLLVKSLNVYKTIGLHLTGGSIDVLSQNLAGTKKVDVTVKFRAPDYHVNGALRSGLQVGESLPPEPPAIVSSLLLASYNVSRFPRSFALLVIAFALPPKVALHCLACHCLCPAP